MNRYQARVSRALIGILLFTLTIGVVLYFRQTTRTSNADTPPVAHDVPKVTTVDTSKPVVVAPPAKADPFAGAAVSSTPTSGGGTPVNVAANNAVNKAAPTTNPAGVQPPTPAPWKSSSEPIHVSGKPFEDAAAKIAADDLLGARKILNDALFAGALSPDQTKAAKQQLGDLNDKIIFSTRKFADDEYGGTFTIPSGGVMVKIANRFDVPAEALMKINGITDPRKIRAGQVLKTIKGPFHAVVDKSEYTLDLYLGSPGERGSIFVKEFHVGLGKDDSTPAGTWIIELGGKMKNPTYYSARGEGVIASGDPTNPLGTRWMPLSGVSGAAVDAKSYGIHGTIHPESIGKMESQGCIRLVNSDVEYLYDLLFEGKSTVVVKD